MRGLICFHWNETSSYKFPSSSSSAKMEALESFMIWLSCSAKACRLLPVCSSSRFHWRLMMIRVLATILPSISNTYSVKYIKSIFQNSSQKSISLVTGSTSVPVILYCRFLIKHEEQISTLKLQEASFANFEILNVVNCIN